MLLDSNRGYVQNLYGFGKLVRKLTNPDIITSCE